MSLGRKCFSLKCLSEECSPASNSCSQLVLEISAFYFHACPQSTAPLYDRRVDEMLVQPLPFFSYAFSQLVNISIHFCTTMLSCITPPYFVRKHFKRAFCSTFLLSNFFTFVLHFCFLFDLELELLSKVLTTKNSMSNFLV